MRRVEQIMGMPVSIDTPDNKDLKPIQAVFDFLRQVDSLYSPYRPSSQVSKFADGTLTKSAISHELRHIIQECDYYQQLTDGYFSAYYNGRFDPSGYVKGWAIDQAAALLQDSQVDTFLINIAGDMVAKGDERIWNIGIQDPFHKQHLLGKVQLQNQAIATSGLYVRGEHIVNPLSGNADSDLISATVYGEDIIMADVLATAYVAMGSIKAFDYMQNQPNYAALLVKQSGEVLSQNNFALLP